MDEFRDTYGPYMEITYILANGNALDFGKVFNMNIHEYLYLGEYFIRKRNIETGNNNI